MSVRAASQGARSEGEAAAADGGRVLDHVTCLGCGCACDDIRVVVRGRRIVQAERACALGAAWFGDGVVPARAAVAGHGTTLDLALDRAAVVLAAATRPLVYVAPSLSCDAQRTAVAIADLLSARLDSVTSATARTATLVAQRRGRASATLGEIRNRADLVIFWGVDPAARYPRFGERYAPDPVGTAVPGGRAGRRVVAVDVGAARGYATADERVAVAGADEGAMLAALRATLLAGDRGALLAGPEAPGAEPARVLARSIMGARYVAVVYDGEAADAGARAEGLIVLAQAANGPTRCALVALRGGGNRSGADAVLTWQTGYPMAVDFARGAPSYEAGRADSAATLGAHDAVLLVGDAAAVPTDVSALLATPGCVCVTVGPFASDVAPTPEVAVDVGLPGVHEGGMALRLDDVPLPLRPPLPGVVPEGAAVLAALALRLRERVERPARAAGGAA